MPTKKKKGSSPINSSAAKLKKLQKDYEELEATCDSLKEKVDELESEIELDEGSLLSKLKTLEKENEKQISTVRTLKNEIKILKSAPSVAMPLSPVVNESISKLYIENIELKTQLEQVNSRKRRKT